MEKVGCHGRDFTAALKITGAYSCDLGRDLSETWKITSAQNSLAVATVSAYDRDHVCLRSRS